MYGKSEDIEKVEPKSVYNGVTENFSFKASREESQNEMQYQNSEVLQQLKKPNFNIFYSNSIYFSDLCTCKKSTSLLSLLEIVLSSQTMWQMS